MKTKNAKRMIAAAVCTVMCAAFTAGCGKKADDNGVKTVTVWSPNTHSKAAYEKWVKQYNEGEGKEKGIYIDYQVQDSTYSEILNIALQNGEGPDLFASNRIREFVDNDYIAAIDDLPGGKEFLSKYDVPYNMQYNGKTYIVPQNVQLQGLVYNKDMFKAAGIVDENGEAKPPETLAEMREYAKRLTDTQSKRYGMALPMKWGGWYSSDLRCPTMSSGGHMGFDPSTGKYDFSVMVPLMQTYLDMKADGSIFPGEEALDNDPARAQFSAGNVGMKICFEFDIGVFNDQFPATCDFGIAPLPVSDAGHKYMQRGDLQGSFEINKKSVEKLGGDVIMEVFKFFTSDETIRNSYAEGLDIPYDWDIVADMELPNAKKGWVDVAKLADIVYQQPKDPADYMDMGATQTIGTRFMNEVWSGKITPEELCRDYTDIMNKLFDDYLADNDKGETRETYMVKDWYDKVKR